MHGFSTALQDLENRRRVDRWAMGLGLALSLVLHLLLLGIPLPSVSAPAAGLGPVTLDRFGTRLVVLPTPELAAPERLLPPTVIPDPVWTQIAAGPRPRSVEGSPSSPAAAPASASLRAAPPDPRLTRAPTVGASSSDLARNRFVTALDAAPALSSTLALRNAALVSIWEDPTDGGSLAPGRVTVEGVTIPFCGGTDPSRCGFGALPWDLERADRWAEYLVGLDAQLRWADRQRRAEAIRSRSIARDTLDGR